MDRSLPGSSVHEFSKQEYWSGSPFSSPEDLPNPGTETGSPALQWILYQLSYQGNPETAESPRANAGILVSGFGFQEEILGLVPTHWCEVMSWG